jgi:excisionase family DNA binding protein
LLVSQRNLSLASPSAKPQQHDAVSPNTAISVRISVPEIALRLNVGRVAVYRMLERGLMPGLRVGRRWIITRHAFEEWERTCGTGFCRENGGKV